MSATRFLDTNIFVYAYDADWAAKRVTAQRLLQEGWSSLGKYAISVQVLQELFVNLRKKGLSEKDTSQVVRDLQSWPVIENTVELLNAALEEHSRWNISLWDGMILAAARESGAGELLTEDLNHGQDYGGVRVVNPFR
jgi:predicted nucleic acid-binding protein